MKPPVTNERRRSCISLLIHQMGLSKVMVYPEVTDGFPIEVVAIFGWLVGPTICGTQISHRRRISIVNPQNACVAQGTHSLNHQKDPIERLKPPTSHIFCR